MLFNWVEGVEVINEQEFNIRERAARIPRIKEKL